MMCGESMITRFCLARLLPLLRNSHPRSGSRCSTGVRSFDACSRLTKMPPMIVVAPSSTWTCVVARCVSIGGMPLTTRLKSAFAFSMVICMITVFALVICGVTLSSSTASLKETVTVLFATV